MSGWLPPLAGAYHLAGRFGVQRTSTHRHRGIDIDAPIGTKWVAPTSGYIEHAYDIPAPGFGGYGRVVVLAPEDEPELHMLWAHGSEVHVHSGDYVERGASLGRVGRSQFRGGDAMDDGTRPARGGGIMGPHLHHETATKPYPMASEDPARVNPLDIYARHGVRMVATDARARAAARAGARAASSRARADDVGQETRVPTREEVAAALLRTDVDIVRVATALRTRGQDQQATLIEAAWAQNRMVILRAAPQDTRSAVERWLDTVRGMGAALAAGGGGALAGAAQAAVRAQEEMWRRLWLGAAVVGGGTLLLLGLGLYVLSESQKGARASADKYLPMLLPLLLL